MAQSVVAAAPAQEALIKQNVGERSADQGERQILFISSMSILAINALCIVMVCTTV
jgi:hypothetical protein